MGDSGHEGPGVGQVDGGDVGDGAGHKPDNSSEDRTPCPILHGKSGWCVVNVGAPHAGNTDPIERPGIRRGEGRAWGGRTATDLVGSSGSRTIRSRWSASGGSPGTEATMTTSWAGSRRRTADPWRCWCRPRRWPTPCASGRSRPRRPPLPRQRDGRLQGPLVCRVEGRTVHRRHLIPWTHVRRVRWFAGFVATRRPGRPRTRGAPLQCSEGSTSLS